MKVLLVPLILLSAAICDGLAQGEAITAPGVIKETMQLYSDGTKSTMVVDPDQHTAKETFTNAAGKLMKSTVYLMDERNMALGAIHYDAKGAIRFKETFQRDAADHIIETSYSSAAGQSLGKRVFVYSGDRLTTIETYDAQGNRIASTGDRTRRSH